MKERPILFSAEMVRALLAGRKTQTRRVAKLSASLPETLVKPGTRVHLPLVDGQWQWKPRAGTEWQPYPNIAEYCHYGQPGDRLWVRERWQSFGDSASVVPPVPHVCQIRYGADGAARWCPVPAGAKGNFPALLKARPSIHMPRWASRLTLEVTGVRVERLQEISEGDAVAEGIVRFKPCLDREGQEGMVFGLDARSLWYRDTAVEFYRSLWESINGPGSWELNPWVWVVEFKVLEGGAA